MLTGKFKALTLKINKSKRKEVKGTGQSKSKSKRLKVITLLVLVIGFLMVTFGVVAKGHTSKSRDVPLYSLNSNVVADLPTENGASEFWKSSDIANKLIRFHVVGNSDSESDQALKRAVRDAILVKVSPRLAKSKSLAESRLILQSLQSEMESIARSVVKSWGKNEQIRSDYGRFQFPTKSYGSIVLPAGEYEALRILIGKAEGANWWCVLYPALCFVNIEHSTAIPVDGKPAVPLQKSAYQENKVQVSTVKPVRFWFWEKMQKLYHNS